jgi:hypothetical protein
MFLIATGYKQNKVRRLNAFIFSAYSGLSHALGTTLGETTWGRCYDHNFLRFLPNFGEKIGGFLKNQCYDQNFA